MPTLLDDADGNPLAGTPAGCLLPSFVPNDPGWSNRVAVLEATALLNRFVAGGDGATDELFGGPKLNIGFDDESDVTGAAGGLGGVRPVGLLATPKLNFGFNASPVPPAVGTLAPGLEPLLVDGGGLEG